MADEIAAQQLVERLHRRRFGDPGGGTGELELERVAGDRRAVEHPPRACRQHRELRGEGGRHRAWHLHTRERHLRSPGELARGGAGRARQLLQVEGVAVRLLVERREVGLLDPRAEQLPRIVRAQRAQL